MINTKIGIFIVVSNNEMLISSKILMIRKHLIRSGIKQFSIYVVDNGSNDRTAEVSKQSNAIILQYKNQTSLEMLMTHIQKRIQNEDMEIIALVDGNSGVESEKVAEMIKFFINKENESGMGYISERDEKGNEEINSLIFKKNVFKSISFRKMRIGKEEDLINFGRSLNLKIDKKQIERKDRIGSDLIFRIPMKSTGDLIGIYRKNNPLRYYGGLFWVFILFSLIPGLYTLDHWMDSSTIDYPSLLITVLLTGIGCIMLSTGLIMNALNILSEKIRGMI